MKIISKLSFLLVAVMLLLSACNNSSERVNYIPAEAVAVLKINTLQIGKKVAWESLTSGALFRDRDSAFDLEKTGIDVVNVFYAYGVADQRLANKMKMVLILPLKDASKWEAFIKKEFPEAAIKKEGDLNFASQDESVAGWDKNTAIVAMDAGGGHGSESMAILTEEVKKAFSLKKEQSIAGNKRFAALEKEAHDVSLFLNYELLMDNVPQAEMGMAGSLMATQRKYVKDTYMAAGMDFDKGKIVADIRYYTNDNSMQMVKNVTPDKIDNEMLKRIPGNQLNGVLAYHINPKGVQSFIDTMGYTGLINSQLEQASLTIEEILNAFTGDIMLAATDFRNEMQTRTYNYDGEEKTTSYSSPTADWLFSMKVKDQNAINKLLQIATSAGSFTQASPDVYISDGIILSVKDGYVAVSNNEKNVLGFIAGTRNANFKIPSEVSDNPYGIYLDIANSVKAIPVDENKDPAQNAVLEDGKKLLENLIAYGGKIKDDHVPFHFELNFQNKNDNSLMQIIKFAEKAKKADESPATAASF